MPGPLACFVDNTWAMAKVSAGFLKSQEFKRSVSLLFPLRYDKLSGRYVLPLSEVAMYWQCRKCGCWNVRSQVRCSNCGALIEPRSAGVA